MATRGNPVKDISFLLAVVHNLDITSEFANDIIDKWPTDSCTAPVDGEDLGRRFEEIWQKWIGDDLDATCAVPPVTAKKNEKDHDGTCIANAITIDDSDDEMITTPALPRKFRIPPAAGLITPLSVDKPITLKAYDYSKIVFKSIERDPEESTPTISRACPITKYNVSVRTLKSFKKAKAINSIKARSTKAKKRPANDFEPESDDDMPLSPPTLSSTRKRRAIDYGAVPSDQVVDDSDGDYEYEEVHEDKRLNKKYDSSFPLLATPSKRQKKAGS